ncbi:substrate-binding domain-containing protein [Gordonia polyisoprenivorans]|uniref:substrate-binding domain-containing protein n=1 Tax=Gordonia polyisoprenivorans TaxID=84595 RepID=UPI001FCA8434|nr:substrate-binding domain-containing protein [Gordonia polyisoprenivorans]
MSGFLRRTRELGIDGRVVPGGATETDGVSAMTALLDQGDTATAVMAFNDRVAIGVLDVLLRRGKSVPQDISVMGYDDSRLSRLAHIDLSTVAQDANRLAQEVVAQAVGQLGGHAVGDVVLPPTLIARRTTGRAPES